MTALRYTEYTLTCDHDECAAFYGPFGVERSRAELRRLAEKDGWTVFRSRAGVSVSIDYCPEHKPDARTLPARNDPRSPAEH